MIFIEKKITETTLLLFRLKRLSADCTTHFETQDDMFTFVYRLYQALGSSSEVVNTVISSGIRVKTGKPENYSSSRLFYSNDVMEIIDYQDIKDKELQEAVRLQFNIKRKRRGVLKDWNLNGNHVRAKAEMEARGEHFLHNDPKPLTLIQENM